MAVTSNNSGIAIKTSSTAEVPNDRSRRGEFRREILSLNRPLVEIAAQFRGRIA